MAGQGASCRSGCARRARRFALVECVVVLLLLGILAAVVVSRAGGQAAAILPTEAALLRAHLRYAQARAMADTAPWGLLLAADHYTLIRDGAAAGQFPGEADSTHVLPQVTLAADAGSLTFNSWGEPLGAGVLLGSNFAITLSGGGSAKSILVTRNTGFINDL